MQDEGSDGERDCRLDRHQGAECGLRQPAQRVELEGPRDERQEEGGGHGDEQYSQVDVTPGLRQADEGGDDCGDGQRDREPVDAIEAICDVLGDDDVQAPECAGEQGEPDAGKARGAVPRLGEEHHSDECERGPGEGSPAATVQGSDEQGAEEFDRDRGAEGEQADGGEEGERHAS